MAAYQFIVRMLLLAALLLYTIPHTAAAPATVEAGTFAAADCMFEDAENYTAYNLACGYLTVPARHADPNGPTIELAVVIIPEGDRVPTIPEPDASQATPLVLAQGGPGGSTIDTYLDLVLVGPLSELRQNRAVVLFDQRGTLYSKPALTCPEELELVQRTIEQRISREEGRKLSLEVQQQCHDRLVAEGIDLAAFNSLENAADIDALRQALGYDKINLYGVSYGTLLALHTLRDYSAGLRSVILDAVVPPQTNFLAEVPTSIDRALSELFRACSAAPDCNSTYPNLEQVFFDQIKALNAEPARVSIRDRDTGDQYNAVLDGDTFLGLMFQMLYASQLLPLLPKMIYDARDGDFQLVARFWPIFAFDRTIADGMYLSVICAEDADFSPDDLALSGVRPQIAEGQREDTATLLQGCRNWGVPELGPAVDQPVQSDVPTLVLSGRFDPITPPAFAEEAAAGLTNHTLVVFPTLGHGALGSSTCATAIVRAFLANPDNSPDTSCAAEPTTLTFVTPANTATTPVIGQVLDQIENGNTSSLTLFGISLLTLLSIFLVWPLTWLIRRLMNAPRPTDSATILAPWLLILIATLTLVFAGALVAVVISTSLAGNDALLLAGLPRESAWLLWLPPLIGLLTVGAVLSLLLAWGQRYWGIGRRIYFTLMVLSCVGLTLSLAQMGLLTAALR